MRAIHASSSSTGETSLEPMRRRSSTAVSDSNVSLAGTLATPSINHGDHRDLRSTALARSHEAAKEDASVFFKYANIPRAYLSGKNSIEILSRCMCRALRHLDYECGCRWLSRPPFALRHGERCRRR